jgi:hypothetical protein
MAPLPDRARLPIRPLALQVSLAWGQGVHVQLHVPPEPFHDRPIRSSSSLPLCGGPQDVTSLQRSAFFFSRA